RACNVFGRQWISSAVTFFQAPLTQPYSTELDTFWKGVIYVLWHNLPQLRSHQSSGCQNVCELRQAIACRLFTTTAIRTAANASPAAANGSPRATSGRSANTAPCYT